MATKQRRYRATATFEGRRIDRTSYKSQRDADRKLAEALEALKNGTVKLESSMLVKDYIEKLLETKTFNSDKTERNYRNRMKNCITDVIGDMKLKDVRLTHCNKCINGQVLKGNGQYMIDQTVIMLKYVFNSAEGDCLIANNPTRGIEKHKPTKQGEGSRRSLTDEELEAFFKAVPKCSTPLYFMVQYGCGCRPSEAKNIEGGDIVNSNGEFYFAHPDGQPYLHIRGTKTKKADRFVPIPPIVMKYVPNNIMPSVKLITNKHGDPMTDGRGCELFKSLVRLMNIEMGCKTYHGELLEEKVGRDLCQYCLRHTYATKMSELVQPYQLQYLLGHSNSSTTDRYVHLSNDIVAERYNDIASNF